MSKRNNVYTFYHRNNFYKNNNKYKRISSEEFKIYDLNGFTSIINTSEKLKHINAKDNYNQPIPRIIFYRGEHRIYDSPNVAGIYRGHYQESALYHAYMRRFYSKFKDMNNFSRLTYMQHFGLSTRLLDITSNPLVALFFACNKVFDKSGDKIKTRKGSLIHKNDGVVHIVLPRKNSTYTIYNSYSDTIELLATLALLKEPSKTNIYKIIFQFNKYISKHKKEYYKFYYNYICGESWFSKYEKYLKSRSSINSKTHHEFSKFENMKNKYKHLYDTYDFQNFIHKIRQDIGDFKETIDVFNILNPVIVQPALNNRRIEAQQGYFIFENFLKDNEISYISRIIRNQFNIINIYIPNNRKGRISNELDREYSINYATLFPDYEHVSKYINKVYKQANEPKDLPFTPINKYGKTRKYAEKYINSNYTGLVKVKRNFKVFKIRKGLYDTYRRIVDSQIIKSNRIIHIKCLNSDIYILSGVPHINHNYVWKYLW